MDIKNSSNTPNFGQIKLSSKDARQVNKLLRQYHKEQSPDVFVDLVDIFAPHFEKEGELRLKSNTTKQDIVQDLYLNLLEHFTKVVSDHYPIKIILKNLNKKSVRPPKTKPIENLTDSEHLRFSYEAELNSAETTTEILDKAIHSTKSLTEKEKDFLGRYRDNQSFNYIGNTFDLLPASVRTTMNKSVHKIKKEVDPQYRAEHMDKDDPPTITWNL